VPTISSGGQPITPTVGPTYGTSDLATVVREELVRALREP
jgi:hypothetical protein